MPRKKIKDFLKVNLSKNSGGSQYILTLKSFLGLYVFNNAHDNFRQCLWMDLINITTNLKIGLPQKYFKFNSNYVMI